MSMSDELGGLVPSVPDENAHSIVRKLGHAVGSNMLALGVSLAVTLLLPKLIGITDYSFWQLYIFYMGYVGVLQFGWSDGIYLRFGGASYASLDRPLLFSQFWSLVASQLTLTLAGAAIIVGISPERSRLIVGLAVAASVTILASRQFCSLLLQATGRIAEYARVLATESIAFLVLASLAWLTGFRDLASLIGCDLVAKTISMTVGIWSCRDVVLGRHRFHPSWTEVSTNIGAGISLMVANVAGLLCIGIIRFGVERSWSVVEFGLISLGLSASSLMMVFFNSVGIVAFPALRRMPIDSRTRIFMKIRNIYVAVAFASLLLYLPIRSALTLWLPAYQRSFAFLAILLPMIVFEGRTVFLTNAYLKTLRRERLILLSNLVSLALSVFLAFVSILWLHRLEFAVLSILVVFVTRGILSEAMLGRLLGLRLTRFQVEEACLAALFSGASWFLGGWRGTLFYAIGLIAVLVHRRSALSGSLRWLRGRTRPGAGSQ